MEPPERGVSLTIAHAALCRRSRTLLLAFVAAAGAAVVPRPSFATSSVAIDAARAMLSRGTVPSVAQPRVPTAAARVSGVFAMADAVAEEAAEAPAGETYEFDSFPGLPRDAPGSASIACNTALIRDSREQQLL